MVMSGRSVNLPTLFLGRLRPPKQLTSTLYTYFRQKLTTALRPHAFVSPSADSSGLGIEPGPLALETDAG